MTKVSLYAPCCLAAAADFLVQVANESLSALRTVQAFNSQRQEELKFRERVEVVLGFARKEAIASAIFFGSTGWSGNVTLLALLGYGNALLRLDSLAHVL